MSPPVESPIEAHELRRSRAIQRRTGPTFFLATRFLPRRIRHETHVLYAFFRLADEVVDGDGDRSPARQRAALEHVRRAALGETSTSEPVLEAFRRVADRRGIPDAEIDAFLDAMVADVTVDRYETMDELEAYMRGSAAAVGVMMTAIMEARDPVAARPHAMALGEALQLTNFLRDVREDARELDRIYLPLESLERHHSGPSDVANGVATPGFRATIQELLLDAERRYWRGVEGIEYLPRDCQFPVVLAAVLYAEHHRRIRDQRYDVLSSRPALTVPDRIRATARTRWHWHRHGDPVATFERAACLPPKTTPPETPPLGEPLAGT